MGFKCEFLRFQGIYNAHERQNKTHQRACYEFGTRSVLMKAHRMAVEGSATWAFVDIYELKYFLLGASNMSSPEKETGVWRLCFSTLPLSGLLLSI